MKKMTIVLILSLLGASTFAAKKALPEVKYFGDIAKFGIGFVEDPSYIELRGDLKISDLAEKEGFVVLFRHTQRDGGEGKVIWDADRTGLCIKGSELNDLGKEQARLISEKVKKYKLQIGEVIASTACRAKQLAEIAFGRYDKTDVSLVYQPMMKFEEKPSFDRKLLEYISSPIENGAIRVLSAHNNTVERLGILGVPQKKLEQGDAAIFKPLGCGNFKYIGTIGLDQWTE